MKITMKHLATWLAAAAIGGAITLAPVASADPGSTLAPQSRVVVPAASSPAPAPSPNGSGEDPFVPNGANPNADEPYDPYIKNPGGGVDLAS